MAKIIRYTGDLKAFGSTAAGTERTVFGGVLQSDVIDDNITADYLTGWGIVGINDAPARQDFNAMGFTVSQILAYLHQMGVAEWDSLQEYNIGSLVVHVNNIYQSLTNANIGNTPIDDNTNWKTVTSNKFLVQTADATPTVIATVTLSENSNVSITARISGAIADYSAGLSSVVEYGARRVAGGAIQLAAANVRTLTDSGGAVAVTCDVNGNDARILVTGVVAETWNWIASVSYDVVN